MIVGVDQMAFFASYLRHTLSLLDIRAEIVASTGGESLQRLGRIDEETLVIALSAGRAHPLLLRAMKLALHRGARTLAISDATMSEVGEHAELTLYFSSNSPSFARSNTALMALVQALGPRSLRPRRSRAQRPHPRLQAEVARRHARLAPVRGSSGRSHRRSRRSARRRLRNMAPMTERATFRVKTGLAEMLKGGVIMDVVTPEQAKIAEEAAPAR